MNRVVISKLNTITLLSDNYKRSKTIFFPLFIKILNQILTFCNLTICKRNRLKKTLTCSQHHLKEFVIESHS